MKLVTIGDSISQGFMSGAAARSDLAYSAIVARELGIEDYHYPEWPAGGIPLNIELILRRLQDRYGTDIGGFEWVTVVKTINDVIDQAEDHYEREAGREDRPYRDSTFFHNLSVRGFAAADAWQVTPKVCRREIAEATKGEGDGFLTGPNAPLHRTALKVLNPSLAAQYDDFSQLDWLSHHVEREGVENLILWLGANNALGTIVSLSIKPTPGIVGAASRPGANGTAFHELSYAARLAAGYNLWHPDDFRSDYRELLRRVDAIMKKNKHPNWRVFVANVPLVTIAPLAKGVGETYSIESTITKLTKERLLVQETVAQTYYKYYTYFPFELEFARTTGLHLPVQDVIHIDRCILRYNEDIARGVVELGDKYHLVDISEALRTMAFKRNDGRPSYAYPEFFSFLYPGVDTKYYHADQTGRLKQGGIFTLDGVHPSPIAHGLIAWEFHKVMQAAGLDVDAAALGTASEHGVRFWQGVFENDLLYRAPIALMHELYDHEKLARHVVGLIRRFMPEALAKR